jgi:periplasmic divalent cation tolerance protein
VDEISLVYVTAPDKEEAENIARTILSERLAACVNVYGGIKSLYLWEGKEEASHETAMMIKTASSLVPALAKKIRQLHSYEVPCILAFPVNYADADYAAWISRETQSGAGKEETKNEKKP